jgi:hypothetical protein
VARKRTGVLLVLLAGCRPEPVWSPEPWSPIEMLSVPSAAEAPCEELARAIETAGEMIWVRAGEHGSRVVPLTETLTIGRVTPRGRSREPASGSDEWVLGCGSEFEVTLAGRRCEVERRSFVVVDLAPLRGREGVIGDLHWACVLRGSLNPRGFPVVFRGPTRELLAEVP